VSTTTAGWRRATSSQDADAPES